MKYSCIELPNFCDPCDLMFTVTYCGFVTSSQLNKKPTNAAKCKKAS